MDHDFVLIVEIALALMCGLGLTSSIVSTVMLIYIANLLERYRDH